MGLGKNKGEGARPWPSLGVGAGLAHIVVAVHEHVEDVQGAVAETSGLVI